MAVTLNANTSTGLVATADLSGAMAFQTSGSTAVTIDSSQRVGIGQTSPTSGCLLDVKGGDVRVENTSGSVRYRMVGGSNQYSLETSSSTNAMMFIDAAAGAERMRIDSSGQVIIGDTSVTNRKFQTTTTNSSGEITGFTNTAGTVGEGLLVNYTGTSPRGTGNRFIKCYDSTGYLFGVQSNGGVANYSGNNSNLSDQREKKNIELAGNYLDKVCSIPVKTFLYLDQATEDTEKTLGVIAQDVQEVAPELVTESNWGSEEDPKIRLSIYQTDLQYALMKSIQELKAIVDAQATEIAELKTKVGP